MIVRKIPRMGSFDAWRFAARELLNANVLPSDLQWDDQDTQNSLFNDDIPSAPLHGRRSMVPEEFLDLARKVIAHRSGERFSLAYRVLWRLQDNPLLLANPADCDVHQLHVLAKNVSRDCHKMKAFVRFRALPGSGNRLAFGAWFEPDHHILELTAPFFMRRFASMDWTISTPQGSASCVKGTLSFASPNGERHRVSDDTEELWKTYFAHIFNPARLKINAMQSEMPRKYWKNLPEAAQIPAMIAGAAKRVQVMRNELPTTPSSHVDKIKAPTILHPALQETEFTSLAATRKAAAHCQRCPLHCHATQTVFGEGTADADIMFVGEQPGDHEDIAGKPFVGPAGHIFNTALAASEIQRSTVYVTNAVKHFKFHPLGKRRIHQRPNRSEIEHCKWWLDKELHLVKPEIVVAMGATALFALTGQNHAISAIRGRRLETPEGVVILPTYHPSAVLRNADNAEAIRLHLFADIALATRLVRNQPEGLTLINETIAALKESKS